MIAIPTAAEQAIASSMLHNSEMFLRKAAEEIAGHDDGKDAPFDVDRATLVTVLIQTAVELAASALVIRHDGLAGVMARNVPATEAEVEERWRAGEIKTVPFEQTKARAQAFLGDEDFWSLVDMFQATRNKLVHFHRPIERDDLYDLKYEATHILIQLIVALAGADEFDLPEGSASFLGKPLFERLIGFEPYRYRVAQVARQIDPGVFDCIICNISAYSQDAEKCLGCGFDGELQFLHCPACNARALYYDHMNLPLNPMMLARCGRCRAEAMAAHCAICQLDYVVPPGEPPSCPWADTHDELRDLKVSRGRKGQAFP
ncbi:MAG: hypothetical protein JWR80_8596 [Bradyrhizobium sp.]|nr:hypothetical protein [Bradyrhizobium sp.]